MKKWQLKRDEKPEAHLSGGERNSLKPKCGATNITEDRNTLSPETTQLIEAVVEKENMTKALRQVERNRGSAGLDKMTVKELRGHLHKEWSNIKEALLEGRYKPQAIKRVEIPKPGGKGIRKLGIPNVLDRLIQQAINQVLSPVFEPGFSESSYGFRPGRSAQMAVEQARQYVSEGYEYVVDMDLEKFFDRVNHDILMSRLARKIKDKRVLRLIRKYLQAGIMDKGVVTANREGMMQGGPLSPLLSNVLLDELDKELEHRGHKFCRYADDCNVYVKSLRSGERVLESITKFLKKRLRLDVNQEKSKVDRPSRRKFLGYTIIGVKNIRLRIANESVKRLKEKLKEQFRRGRGRNVKRFIEEELNITLRGWASYFRLNEVKGVVEELDRWLRRRLRLIIWRQWKKPKTRKKKLRTRGLSEEEVKLAGSGYGPWWNSGQRHMNFAFTKADFDQLGLFSLQEFQKRQIRWIT